MHGSVRPRVTPSPAPARQDGAARSAVPVALLSAAVGTLGAGAAALAWGGVAALVVVGAAGVAAGAFALAWARGIDQERARLEARLAAVEAARARAEADNLAKSRFLAEMSHELRTPLNTVMGFSEMMADEVLGPHRVPAYGGYARDILGSGRHLLALADDLLDLARIESGHRVLLETPVHLSRLGAGVPRHAAAGCRQPPPDPASGACRGRARAAVGDERAVRQIILNLLANAVKFTPQDGEVRLVTGIDASGALFLAVEDTGAGVSERELPLEDARHRESRLDVKMAVAPGWALPSCGRWRPCMAVS